MNTKSFLFKMCSGLVASLFVLTLVLTGFSVYALRSLLYDQYGGKLTDAAEGVDHLMEIYEANALAHARVIAEDPQIVAALQSRDFQTMLAASAPLMKDGGLDYMVLTDPSGHALIRTHQPTKVPKADDSIASQQNVKEAMGGKAFVTLEEGKTVRLSVRAGAPVYDANHQLIGVVSTGYVVSKNEIAEMAKSMFGADMMAFLKGEMIATSLKGADGENLSEYEEKDEDLLQKVEGEGGKAVAPLSLAGKDYLAAYAPLKDADGNIIGMVAMANELSPITAAVLKTTLTSIAFSVLILVIATVLAFLYFRRMLALIAVVQERLRYLAEGDLTQPPLAVTSEDELGLLAHECNEMSEKLAKVIKSVSGQADSVAESSGALRENSTQTADATWLQSAFTSSAYSGATWLSATMQIRCPSMPASRKAAGSAEKSLLILMSYIFFPSSCTGRIRSFVAAISCPPSDQMQYNTKSIRGTSILPTLFNSLLLFPVRTHH